VFRDAGLRPAKKIFLGGLGIGDFGDLELGIWNWGFGIGDLKNINIVFVFFQQGFLRIPEDRSEIDKIFVSMFYKTPQKNFFRRPAAGGL
jgi:hypothetical protein